MLELRCVEPCQPLGSRQIGREGGDVAMSVCLLSACQPLGSILYLNNMLVSLVFKSFRLEETRDIIIPRKCLNCFFFFFYSPLEIACRSFYFFRSFKIICYLHIFWFHFCKTNTFACYTYIHLQLTFTSPASI